jgi:hypothetical protein
VYSLSQKSASSVHGGKTGKDIVQEKGLDDENPPKIFFPGIRCSQR